MKKSTWDFFSNGTNAAMLPVDVEYNKISLPAWLNWTFLIHVTNSPVWKWLISYNLNSAPFKYPFSHLNFVAVGSSYAKSSLPAGILHTNRLPNLSAPTIVSISIISKVVTHLGMISSTKMYKRHSSGRYFKTWKESDISVQMIRFLKVRILLIAVWKF